MGELSSELVPIHISADGCRWFVSLSDDGLAKRLIVFVHGFNGRAVETWRSFHEARTRSEWWAESDLLFIGYNSLRREVGAVASYIRQGLEAISWPTPDVGGGATVAVERYSQIVLVGHSLGGVVLRRMLLDVYSDYVARSALHPNVPFPALLAAQLVLFSPAISGFAPSRTLGFLQQTGLWGGIQALLCSSPAYNALSDNPSPILNELRTETEAAIRSDPRAAALRARIVWADPDGVVRTQKYSCDPAASWAHDRSHSQVCKPDVEHPQPWTFVELGGW